MEPKFNAYIEPAVLSLDVAFDLLPQYHFTRLAGEMNDPNGLLLRSGTPSTSGEPTFAFHMFLLGLLRTRDSSKTVTE